MLATSGSVAALASIIDWSNIGYDSQSEYISNRIFPYLVTWDLLYTGSRIHTANISYISLSQFVFEVFHTLEFGLGLY